MNSTEPCKTCKYKETSGDMVDPCFPCLLPTEIYSGFKKRMFNEWMDERLTWKEIYRYKDQEQEEFNAELESDPEFIEAMDKLVQETIKSQAHWENLKGGMI